MTKNYTMEDISTLTQNQRIQFYKQRERQAKNKSKEVANRLTPSVSEDEKELALLKGHAARHGGKGPFTAKVVELEAKIEKNKEIQSRLDRPDALALKEFFHERRAELIDRGATPEQIEGIDMQYTEVYLKDPSREQSDLLVTEVSNVLGALDLRDEKIIVENNAQAAELLEQSAALKAEADALVKEPEQKTEQNTTFGS